MLNFEVLLDKVASSLISEENDHSSNKEKYDQLQKEIDELEKKIKEINTPSSGTSGQNDELNKLKTELLNLQNQQQEIMDEIELNFDNELSSPPTSMSEVDRISNLKRQSPHGSIDDLEQQRKNYDNRSQIITNAYNYLKTVTNNFETTEKLMPPPQGETPEYKEILEDVNGFLANETIQKHKKWLGRLIKKLRNKLPNFGLYVNFLVINLLEAIVLGNREDINILFDKLTGKISNINKYFIKVGKRLGIVVNPLPNGDNIVQQPIIKPKTPISPERLAILKKYKWNPNGNKTPTFPRIRHSQKF